MHNGRETVILLTLW